MKKNKVILLSLVVVAGCVEGPDDPATSVSALAISSQSNKKKQRPAQEVHPRHRRVIWPEVAREQRMMEAIASSAQTGEAKNLQALESSADVGEVTTSSFGGGTDGGWVIPPIYSIIPMVQPQIQTLDGEAPDTTQGAPHHETGYAVVELVISNFTKCSGPEVRIYDDEDPGSDPTL